MLGFFLTHRSLTLDSYICEIFYCQCVCVSEGRRLALGILKLLLLIFHVSTRGQNSCSVGSIFPTEPSPQPCAGLLSAFLGFYYTFPGAHRHTHMHKRNSMQGIL